MNTVLTPSRLLPLVVDRGGPDARASSTRVCELHEASDVTPKAAHDFVVCAPAPSRRNLGSIGPWYEIVVICGQSGPRRLIYHHAASACALKSLPASARKRFSLTRPTVRSSFSTVGILRSALSALRQATTGIRFPTPSPRASSSSPCTSIFRRSARWITAPAPTHSRKPGAPRSQNSNRAPVVA